MSRATQLMTDLAEDIAAIAERFSDHEGMDDSHVAEWLGQFDAEDTPLALRVLGRTRYYGQVEIRTMAKQLIDVALEQAKVRGMTRVAFVAAGTPGSGSSIVIRAAREHLAIRAKPLLDMLAVSHLKPNEYDVIVFIDDFSGTGTTLTDWWATVESSVEPTNAAVWLGLLVATKDAVTRVKQFADWVHVIDQLPQKANVFAKGNTQFSSTQKTRLHTYCQRTGAHREYVSGLGRCGLLLAFKYGCPDNSLPVLWHPSPTWRPLFQRRGI